MTAAMVERPPGVVPVQTHVQSIDERVSHDHALRASSSTGTPASTSCRAGGARTAPAAGGVRQPRDARIKPQLETMTARHLRRYAERCGEVLARAHVRTADAVILSGHLGGSTAMDEAIGVFANAYMSRPATQCRTGFIGLFRALQRTCAIPIIRQT